jgi:hypothetical protein
MKLKYIERTKKSANGHNRDSCFVIENVRLHFYYDKELILKAAKLMLNCLNNDQVYKFYKILSIETAKDILDDLDHHQVYEFAQKLIKNNALRAKRETNIETSLLSCKDSCSANTWELNI